MSTRTDGYLPLRDYALLGDCHGAALVGRDGSVDWFCPGRFDAQPVCWRLLDARKGAFFQIAPAHSYEATRDYVPDTNILRTVFATGEGTVSVTDFLPVGRNPQGARKDTRDSFVDLSAPGWLVRIIEGLEGQCNVTVRYYPGACVFDHNAAVTPAPLLFRDGDPGVDWFDREIVVAAGDRIAFVLAPEGAEPARHVPELLEVTTAFWNEWCALSQYDGPHQAAVRRSALALKALTYAPSGAIVAAPTTSLPEEIGGVRNWDYRYSWLRDSAFVLQALAGLGYDGEAGRYCEFLGRCCVDTLPNLQILYGIEGKAQLKERELHHLEGYARSSPVRVGNAASDQFQLDIYGEVADWAQAYCALGGPIDDALETLLRGIADHVAGHWREPDQGIWEMRGEPRQYVHGKAMAWVALDRAIRLLGAREEWTQARTEIFEALKAHGRHGPEGAFRQTFEDGGMDAVLLLLPLLDLPPLGDTLALTVQEVENILREGDFVRRYSLVDTDDGLDGADGAFLICSFWLVDALLCSDRAGEARELFDRLLGKANSVGLYAEEIDLGDESFLGNFPQAFTHLALINSAINLQLFEAGGADALRGTHADRLRRVVSSRGGGSPREADEGSNKVATERSLLHRSF
tara:strand:- start:435 stop:2333 length:1899 start_codon:yes stop_codon:yes gene_type:complete